MASVSPPKPAQQQKPVPKPIPSNPPTIPVKKPNKLALAIFALLALTVIGGAGYYFFQKFYKKSAPSEKAAEEKKTTQPTFSLSSLKNNLPQFAEWKIEKTEITPSIPSYTIEANELSNLKDIQKAVNKNLSSEQLQALNSPGFFVTPAENKLADGEKTIDFMHFDMIDEFLMHYQDIAGESLFAERKPENAVFITSDLLLHSFHVFLERTFEYIEETKFQPKLSSLTDLLWQKSLDEYSKTSDKQIKNSFERLTTFFLVPKVILETSQPKKDEFLVDPAKQEQASASNQEVDKAEKILAKLDSYKSKLPDKIYQTAKSEIELISKADGSAISPLFGPFKKGQLDDYTQYKPRSHYTKNSILRSYWKAMIWYGRNGFLTKSDELTLDAMIQTLLLNSLKMEDSSSDSEDKSALQTWENIYLPTVFFVGKSDDITVYDYTTLIKQIYGKDPVFTLLTNQKKFNQFKEKVKELAGPMIQSSIILVEPGKETESEILEETKSFRFMGQRFIPDSFIFSQLTQGDTAPDPETGQSLPAIPTALMPMSIFNSERAELHLQDWIAENTPDSDQVIAKEKKKLADVFSQLEITDWTQNIYWSWLYTLRSLFQTFSEGYPMFMQNEAWNDKDLNSSLGSWTELRHDTLLYAKQSYAEMGAAGPPEEQPPVPKGYVEPNLQFLNRLIALAQMTQDGLAKNNVLPEEQKWKIEQLIDVFKFYRKIAIKELKNEKISDDEFETLRTSHIKLNRCLQPATGSFIKASEARAGLIADVHTGMTMAKQEILYEATGIPNIIFVAIKDANGTRLTRGIVYSYYEFTHPFGERLSDQNWQSVIYEGQTDFSLPSVPNWVKTLAK